MTPSMPAWRLLAAIAVLGAPAFAQPQSITNGRITVRIDPMGVMVRPPDQGLVATYGPRHAFVPGSVEWFGLAYDTLGGHVSASGAGAVPDYARRTPVSYVSSSFQADSATTLGKVGALEITHTFAFCPHTECLVIGVELRNTGRAPIDNIVYSREWRHDTLPAGTFPEEWAPALPPGPEHVWRLAWMPNNLLPGRTQGAAFAVVPSDRSTSDPLGPAADDVPLQWWKGGSFPGGLIYGETWGISFADYDHDGWTDVIDAADESIWRNLGGTDWVEQVDLRPWFTNAFRYGAAAADYDNDQLLDIADEPRGGCVFFVHALGNDVFEEIAGDPSIVDVRPCNAPCETNSVADVDGDGNLDWFFPVYPDWIGGSGNWFLFNNGPDAGGVYTFTELSGPAGLDNPPAPVNRPEGAEWVDVDGDGDVDLYSNNTIYRNVSTLGNPLFEAMTEDASGVVFSDVLDEGGGFLDYDMDGDMDLCLAFCDTTRGVRMFENLGDGTFLVQPRNLFDSFNTGLCLGLSYEDWDHDGDVDVTSSEVFRRNQFQETGMRHFTVATHSIPASHVTDATPAWGDWDQDGDRDSALGNWGERGRLYENTTYDASTPAAAKRHVRVRVMRDSDVYDDGLETEFGAQVSVVPLDHPVENRRRVRVVSTSAGYLNQNEYVVHVALPADPDPDPAKDVRFRVIVDFKGNEAQAFHRVDRHVNPVLGDLDLAQLDDREIVVYRSGRVRIDGCDFMPGAPVQPLTTVNGGLVLAGVTTPIPPVVPAPGADWFVGLEVDTSAAVAPLRVEELIVDGKITPPRNCSGTDANVWIWDVTVPGAPVLAAGGQRSFAVKARNDRNGYPIDATLEPGRIYRVVARVDALRATPVAAPIVDGVLTTTGGLSFQDAAPCTGAGAEAALVDPANLYLTLRFRDEPAGAWADLGHALAGTGGAPVLAMSGDMRPLTFITADVSGALPDAPLWIVVGLTPTCIPFAGGVLVPAPDIVLSGLFTDSTGAASYSDCISDTVPSGESFFIQALVLDPGAVDGFAMTNAMGGTTPY